MIYPFLLAKIIWRGFLKNILLNNAGVSSTTTCVILLLYFSKKILFDYKIAFSSLMKKFL